MFLFNFNKRKVESGMAKKSTKKKKKGSYDNPKLFTYISIGLAAIIVIISALVLLIHFSNNYVGKVKGEKIYDYEYEYFLYIELSEMYASVDVTDLSDAEKAEKYEAFWNTKDEDGLYPEDRAKEQALEEARKFKASYILANEKGFKVSRKEAKNLKLNIDTYINQMLYQYQAYGLSVTKEALVKDLTGTMNLAQYKNFMVQQACIEKYKDALKENYAVSEGEIKSIYDEARDDYRFIELRVFFKSALDEDKKELSEEDYAKFLEEMQEIAEAFNEDGKYDDKSFSEYIKEHTEDSSKDGLYTINKAEGGHKSEKINEYAYGLEREDLEKNEYVLIEDEDTEGIYIVLLEKIIDLDTEDDPEDEDAISGKDIKDGIISVREEEMAIEDIENAVDNDKYKVVNRKDKIMQKYIDGYGLRS